MATYILADAKFFNQEAAQSNGLTVEQYNQMIVDNCNSIVLKDDFLIIMGDIASATKEQIAGVLKSLNGTKQIIDFHEGKLSKDEWRELGVSCHNIGGLAVDKNNEYKSVYILTSMNGLVDYLTAGPCAAAYSLPIGKHHFKKRVLNLSTDNWGYYPIEYCQLPRMYQDMKEFNEMREV